jgi:hypothetical protein
MDNYVSSKSYAMRKYIITLALLIVTSSIHAQKDTAKKIETIFKKEGRIGWWAAPEFAYTKFDVKNVLLAGISGGIIINHSFSIGLAGYGIVNPQKLKYSGINDTSDVYLYGGYGGFLLEYRLMPLRKINVAFPLLIGGGGAAYSLVNHNNNWQHNSNDDNVYLWDTYFVLEPGVMVGINLFNFMRLDVGTHYRFVMGLELPRTSSNMMNAFNLNASLKFGRF